MSESRQEERVTRVEQEVDKLREANHESVTVSQKIFVGLENIQSHLGRQDTTLAEQSKRIDATFHHITGNGSPERGLIVRVDRLERIDADRRLTALERIRWKLAGAAAVIIALAEAVHWYLGHKG